MSFRTDLKPLWGYRYIFGTSTHGVFVVRLRARMRFLPVNAAEFKLRIGDAESVNDGMSQLDMPMMIPLKCTQNGSVVGAKEELRSWALDHGFVDLMGVFRVRDMPLAQKDVSAVEVVRCPSCGGRIRIEWSRGCPRCPRCRTAFSR